MPSSTEENYLKTIFRHARGTETRVPLGRIAQDLAVTPGTVTTMMKQLAGRDLVLYRSRQGVQLTVLGEKTALSILRRHRLIELFLVEVMAMDWADVHTEAEELEHVVSDALVNRMDEMLGYPEQDPHGDPIPSAEGELPRPQSQPLTECEPGAYSLLRVLDDAAGFLGWLKDCGLLPGTAFTVERIDPFAEVAILRLPDRDSPLQIALTAAAKLLVVPAPTPERVG